MGNFIFVKIVFRAIPMFNSIKEKKIYEFELTWSGVISVMFVDFSKNCLLNMLDTICRLYVRVLILTALLYFQCLEIQQFSLPV
jgi:hypothetical protein